MDERTKYTFVREHGVFLNWHTCSSRNKRTYHAYEHTRTGTRARVSTGKICTCRLLQTDVDKYQNVKRKDVFLCHVKRWRKKKNTWLNCFLSLFITHLFIMLYFSCFFLCWTLIAMRVATQWGMGRNFLLKRVHVLDARERWKKRKNAYAYVCAYVRTHVCSHVRNRACMYTRMCAGLYARERMHPHVYASHKGAPQTGAYHQYAIAHVYDWALTPHTE